MAGKKGHGGFLRVGCDRTRLVLTKARGGFQGGGGPGGIKYFFFSVVQILFSKRKMNGGH